uniref:Uncharacterized protein n=1 Tax=Siphoviridae sp. ctbbV81 TaxID=2827900 RepID=A0A8S5TQG8_9CAUD|nr:MAG TPA: hypothetical protein [Siphoviridae sp. ctbbV81]
MTLAGNMRVKGWKSPPIWTFDALSDNDLIEKWRNY